MWELNVCNHHKRTHVCITHLPPTAGNRQPANVAKALTLLYYCINVSQGKFSHGFHHKFPKKYCKGNLSVMSASSRRTEASLTTLI